MAAIRADIVSLKKQLKSHEERLAKSFQPIMRSRIESSIAATKIEIDKKLSALGETDDYRYTSPRSSHQPQGTSQKDQADAYSDGQNDRCGNGAGNQSHHDKDDASNRSGGTIGRGGEGDASNNSSSTLDGE